MAGSDSLVVLDSSWRIVADSCGLVEERFLPWRGSIELLIERDVSSDFLSWSAVLEDGPSLLVINDGHSGTGNDLCGPLISTHE